MTLEDSQALDHLYRVTGNLELTREEHLKIQETIVYLKDRLLKLTELENQSTPE